MCQSLHYWPWHHLFGRSGETSDTVLCLWFRASLIYINNCPTRCNTKQSLILQVYSTCFACQPHPSSGVHKTVTTAFCNGHIFCAAASLQRGQASLATLEGGSWMVPEAEVTVLCTPDDGCGWHPKHVEWTCRIIDCVVLHLIRQLIYIYSDTT